MIQDYLYQFLMDQSDQPRHLVLEDLVDQYHHRLQQEIPREELSRTFTAWDLGMGDSTSIWVAQLVGTEVRLIDYYENHGVGLDHYVKWIKD